MDESDLACFRCGEIGHLRANCPRARPVPAADSAGAPSAEAWYPQAREFRRDPVEISPPTPEYLRAREHLRGMPEWLRKRMLAWHQVTESRRQHEWILPPG
jgi:zinc knuckle protein